MPQRGYTISVRGEKFVFTKGHLDSDPENYFSTCFFGPFMEGEQQLASGADHELVLYSDPKLFKLIQAHLCGYQVFPIPSSWVPEYMTPESALENLKRDADYYGLKRLADLVHEEMVRLRNVKVLETHHDELVEIKKIIESLNKLQAEKKKEKVFLLSRSLLDWQGHEVGMDDFEVAQELNEEGCRFYIDHFNREEHCRREVYPHRVSDGCRLVAAWRDGPVADLNAGYENWVTIVEYV